jgi:hypothetical protein
VEVLSQYSPLRPVAIIPSCSPFLSPVMHP